MVEYPASGAFVRYNYLYSGNTIKLGIEGDPENIDLELYLTENKKPVSVNIAGADFKINNKHKPENKYFRCRIRKFNSKSELKIKISEK